MRILLLNLVFCLISLGCASNIVLHPLTDTDVKPLAEGAVFTAPTRGWWFSSYYVQEVMKIKIEAAK